MPLSHTTKWYAVSDIQIAKVTADPSGGTTTYGSLIDVPGAKTMGIDFAIDSKDLRGDNRLLDTNSTLTAVNVTVTHAKLNLDVMAALLGGAVSDSGTTPAQIAKWALTGANVTIAPFKIEGASPTAGTDSTTGDGHWVLYKCTLTGLSGLGFAEEDYVIPSFTCRAYARLSDNKWMDGVVNETAAAIV